MNTLYSPPFGKRLLGLTAAAAPAVLLLAFVIGPSMAISDPSELLSSVAADRGAVIAQSILLLAATLLFVPVFFGLIHVVRERGSIATRVASGLFAVGLIGHSGLAFLRLALVQVSHSPHHEAMVELTTSLEHGVLLALLPLLSAFDLALILLFVGLRRARLAPSWTVALAAGIAVSAGVLGGSRLSFLIAGALGTILGGWMSRTILTIPDRRWMRHSTNASSQGELQAA